MKRPFAFTLIVFISGGWLHTQAADAGGYASARFGGEHGNPASDHNTAIYFNPAGLALGHGTRVYVEGLFVHRLASYDRPADAIDNPGAGTPDDGIIANSGKAELSNFLVAPFLSVASDLGVDGLGVSVGVYAPFGGQASWGTDDQFLDDDQFPGAVDGAQRWSTIEGYQRVIYATAAGAYRLPGPRLSFGVGVNVVSQSLALLRARNLDGSDDIVAPDGSVQEGRSLIEGTDLSVSIGAGVMWEATDALRIGASYQSMPGFGETVMDSTLTNKFGDTALGDPIDTELLYSVPDVFRLGVAFRASPRLELRASGDFTRWSVFERHCLLQADDPNRSCVIADNGAVDVDNGGSGVLVVLPRDWNDTFGVRAGASYWLSDTFELFGGTGYDSNAVPDDTLDAGLMDMDKIVTSAGVRLGMMNARMLLTASLTNVLYFSRETAPRADDPQPPSRNPDGAGKYTQLINLLTLGAQYSF